MIECKSGDLVYYDDHAEAMKDSMSKQMATKLIREAREQIVFKIINSVNKSDSLIHRND